MEAGDLICFNVGGMKKKTLGVLLDVKRIREGVRGKWHTFYKVLWIKLDKYSPTPAQRFTLGRDATEMLKFLPLDTPYKAKTGCTLWFENTNFEVVSKATKN